MKSNTYLTETPVSKLMLTFAVPCIMAMLVSSLYNIVDQIFIGRGIGYLGNGATNVVFPLSIIAVAFALMIGDGCAAYMSICQGQKDTAKAGKSVGNAITLLLAVSLILVCVFVGFEGQLLNLFGATENNLPYALDYFSVIIIGIPFFLISNGLNSIIRADGSPKYAMAVTLAGCMLNVILDPIAIFILHWGVKGAAIATIVGQIVSAVLSVYCITSPKTFALKRNDFIPDLNILSKILTLGISSFLTQLSIVIIMGVMNSTLVKYGALSEYGADIPMTVIGIVMKVFQIVISFVVGIAAGCQPIVGYNYGAGRYDRVKEIYKKMMLVEIAIGVITTILFEIFPVQIISIFGSESALYNQYATYAFRIFLSTMILTCVVKSTSIFLQSVGKPVQAMSLSLLREFILSVPLVLLLPRVMNLGVMGPLFSAPIADVISIVFTVFFVAQFMSSLEETEPETVTA